MSRRKAVLLGVALAVSLVAGGATYLSWDELFPPPPGVTPRAFARLRPGMTEERVCQIMGGPTLFVLSELCNDEHCWGNDDCSITVVFGVDGRAVCGTLRYLDGSERTETFGGERWDFFATLRRLLPCEVSLMGRRTKCLLLLLIATTALAAGYAAWRYAMTPTPGVTPENYGLLRRGMSPAETEAILGPANEGPLAVEHGTHYFWWKGSGELEIALIFHDDIGLFRSQRMTHCSDGTCRCVASPVPAGPSLLDTIRSLLHL